MRGKVKIPWTWSPCVRTRDRIVVNPEEIGVGGIPVLGLNRARNMSAGAEPHRHRAMEITVCEHGAVKFDADGRAWTLLPGTVFVSQSGVVHRLRSNVRGSILRWIFVTLPKKGECFLGLSKDDSATLAARLRALDARLYRIPVNAQHLIEELFNDYGRGAETDEMRLVRFLLPVIDAVPVQHEVRSASPIRAVIAQMRREPENEYPIERLISETQLSETSLATAFKRETGQTPHEFLVTCRIHKARTRLRRMEPSGSPILHSNSAFRRRSISRHASAARPA